MRFAYCAQAVSAQPGSLALTATTWSLGTRFRFCRALLLRRVEAHGLAAPDLLEIVEAAHRGMHDVDHDVAEIDQHPLPGRFALDAVDARAELAHALLHAVRQCLHLPVRIAARDHHALEHRGQARRVEHQDVASLHILERLHHHPLLQPDVHQGDISKIAFTSTAKLKGRAAAPTAKRVWRPASPSTSTSRSEAPFNTFG